MNQRVKVFRDPVYSNIEFDPSNMWDALVLRLVDTPEVQRLRHIRQLGLASIVYHGAEHSRFSHSLGVTHIARRLYQAAVRNAGGHTDDELCVVLAAALLHDTGHPPFSHAVESVLGVKHEALSLEVLKGNTRVNQILKEFGGDTFVGRVADHIKGSSDARTTQLISSQMDADRLDYVLRDGFHAGVPNASYDIERILQLAHLDPKGLVFDRRSQYAIEGYFMARYHLYLQLYYHRTVRAAEVLLRSALRRAKAVHNNGVELGNIPTGLKSLFASDNPLDALRLTDHDIWAAFNVWSSESKDKVLQDLSRRMMHREPFKAIEVEGKDLQSFYETKLPSIKAAASNAGFDPDYYVVVDTAKDQPYKIADYASGDSPKSVRLLDSGGTPRSLEVISKIIGALQQEAYQKVRCCFPSEIRAEAES
jgi:HD superfamily phosphohydrolase